MFGGGGGGRIWQDALKARWGFVGFGVWVFPIVCSVRRVRVSWGHGARGYMACCLRVFGVVSSGAVGFGYCRTR